MLFLNPSFFHNSTHLLCTHSFTLGERKYAIIRCTVILCWTILHWYANSVCFPVAGCKYLTTHVRLTSYCIFTVCTFKFYERREKETVKDSTCRITYACWRKSDSLVCNSSIRHTHWSPACYSIILIFDSYKTVLMDEVLFAMHVYFTTTGLSLRT